MTASHHSVGKRNLKDTISIHSVQVNYKYVKAKSDGHKHKGRSGHKSQRSKQKSKPSLSGSEEKVIHKPFFQFNPRNSKNIMTNQKVYDYKYSLENQNSSS